MDEHLLETTTASEEQQGNNQEGRVGRRKLAMLLGSGIFFVAVISAASFFSHGAGYRKNLKVVKEHHEKEEVTNTLPLLFSQDVKVDEGTQCRSLDQSCGMEGCCSGLTCFLGLMRCRPPNDPGCFSSITKVDVMGKGTVPIHEVKVGDSIKSRKDGTYSRVFGFHKNDAVETLFRRIHTDIGSALEITPRHMLFLHGEEHPIPASEINVGDELKQMDSNGATKLKVTKIEFVHRKGFYAPITEDGTLVVDGVVASSFAVHPDKGDSVSFDKMGLLHWHGLSQVAISPVRFICKAMWSGFCTNEALHNDEGLHKYIVFMKHLRGLNDWQQVLVLPAVMTVGVFFNSVEYVYDTIAGNSAKLSDGNEARSIHVASLPQKMAEKSLL